MYKVRKDLHFVLVIFTKLYISNSLKVNQLVALEPLLTISAN